MEFKELTEYCQALAMAGKVLPDEVSVWRYMCRIYSKKFNTPLDQVINMDPEWVMLNVYEDQLDELDLEENLEKFHDIILGLEDPEYDSQKKEELDEFIDMAEQEEAERIKKGKPIHPAMKTETSLPDTPQEQTPKGGMIDLSYLDKEES